MASTVSQLIVKGKAENAYNNSGIEYDSTWREFFNDALADLVDDLDIEDVTVINFDPNQREYELPENYYGIKLVLDSSGRRIRQRHRYEATFGDVYGYWTMNKGSRYVIDFYHFTSPETFTVHYVRYPAELTSLDDQPEVPKVGERALVYYALAKALRNNNQVGQAIEMENRYEQERKKIRNARARG